MPARLCEQMSDSSAATSVRIGVLGGTFDPIHCGHLLAASEAAHALDLDRIIFVPSGESWQKSGRHVSPPAARYDMALIATADDRRFEVSRVDLDRPGPTFTVDTLTALRDRYRAGPGARPEWFFLVGVDALNALDTWERPDEAVNLAQFVAIARPGHENRLPVPLRDRVFSVATPSLDISSSECRRRARAGEPLTYLVPGGVAAYIAKTGLYQGSGE